MTEKRFGVINISKNGMKGLFQLDNDNLSVYDVARLLNELIEENEQLKQDKTNLHRAMSRDRVRYLNENEELKHQNELLSDELEQCKAVINKKWSEYLQKKELDV